MYSRQGISLPLCSFVVSIVMTASFSAESAVGSALTPQTQQPAAQSAAAKQVVGAVKSVRGNTLTLTPDTGPDVDVKVQNSIRIVRVAPGQTDLKNATAIQLPEIQVGDRILVRGTPSTDGQSLVASSVIAMKRSDVEAKQQHDREDWQKRGIGGLVGATDPGAGTIMISAAAAGGTKIIAIHTTKETIIRRYAPDSVQFDDAKTSSLSQIKSGDQLRARGTRSPDGTEFAAEEIVSGAFRNISGTISALDAASSALTVMDLVTKKPVQVKISAQSQVLKLPPQMAQRIAVQMKGGGGDTPGGLAAGITSGTAPEPAGEGRNQRGGANGGNPRPGGVAADLQQILSRMPKATLGDLQTGDAVMMVSTEGTALGGVTAITLLAGVEPILQASPRGGQAMTLSPWTLGGGAGEDAGQGNP
jgi:hypothetical protein